MWSILQDNLPGFFKRANIMKNKWLFKNTWGQGGCSRSKIYERDVTTKYNVWDRVESWLGEKKSFNIKEILETTGKFEYEVLIRWHWTRVNFLRWNNGIKPTYHIYQSYSEKGIHHLVCLKCEGSMVLKLRWWRKCGCFGKFFLRGAWPSI